MIQPTKQPPADISKQVTSLAREIDRLPKGEYVITVDNRRNDWVVRILQGELLRSWTIQAFNGSN